MNRTLLLAVAGILIACTSFAQMPDAILNKLQQRYDKAFRWGNIYVVQANGYYAWMDKNGQLIAPFSFRLFDTVLADRAIASEDSSGHHARLIDADGNNLSVNTQMHIRLVNKKNRLFGFGDGITEMLYTDSARQATFQPHELSLPDSFLMMSERYNTGSYSYGVITHSGDTVIPAIYDEVSIGHKLYAARKGDSIFVYKHGKGLLFSKAGVHGINILGNDLIVINKYGASALIDQKGKLLTGFKYYKISELMYPYSIMPADRYGQQLTPPIVPGYAETGATQSKGLIDSSGHEIFPQSYDNIDVNTNGWFIVRKAMHDDEELLDNNRKTVLKSNAFSINFIDSRYVTVTKDNQDNDDEVTRTYDMVLRKYVNKTPAPAMIAGSIDHAPQPFIENKYIVADRYDADSMIINQGGSVLKRNGRLWGVLSVKGDTILAFEYDTAGLWNYAMFFAGTGGRYSILNNEGAPAIPVLLPELPQMLLPDSALLLKSGRLVSYKGGRLSDIQDKKYTDWLRQPFYEYNNSGMMYISWNNGVQPGIYNRKKERLADMPMSTTAFRRTGIAVVINPADSCYAIIDSTGRFLLPWVPAPGLVQLYDHCALLVYDKGHKDVLWRLNNGNITVDSVELDSSTKQQLFLNRSYLDGRPVVFNKEGYGKGYIIGNAAIINGADKIVCEMNSAFVKRGNKWGAYDAWGKQEVPIVYDSIAPVHDNYYYLYNDHKMGLYDKRNGHVYAAVHDTICYPGSLANHFLIAHKDGLAIFYDETGKIISDGWNGIAKTFYGAIMDIPANKGRKKYRLYTTLDSAIQAVPDNPNTNLGVVIEYFMDGAAIMNKNGKYGVYDMGYNKWLVPQKYSSITKEDDYFVAYTSVPSSTSVYNPEGRFMFTIAGQHEMQPIYPFGQWSAAGWYGLPVVNAKGRIIIPDKYDHVYTVESHGRYLYQVMTTDGKRALIDTNGKILIPPILDYIEDDVVLNDGYFIGSQDQKKCLISPKGKMLTKCLYEDIFEEGPDTRAEKNMWANAIQININNYNPPPDPASFIAVLDSTHKFGVLGHDGKVLVPCVYDSIRQICNRKVIAMKNNKWGLITLANKPVTAFKYDIIGTFLNGTASFRRENISGTLTIDGKETPDK